MRIAPVFLVALFLMPAASAAPFLQSGADAHSSGNVGNAGPTVLDTSFLVDLERPIFDALPVSPIIDGDHVYVMTAVPTGAASTFTSASWRIDRIDLLTGDTVQVQTGPDEVSTSQCFAKSGNFLFLGSTQRLLAIDAVTGAIKQEARLEDPNSDDSESVQGCMAMRLTSDRVITASGTGGSWTLRSWTHGLDLEWAVTNQELGIESETILVPSQPEAPVAGYVTDIAVGADVIALMEMGVHQGTGTRQVAWILEMDGELRRAVSIPEASVEDSVINGLDAARLSGMSLAPGIAIWEDTVFANGDSLVAHDLSQQASTTIHLPDAGGPYPGGLAVDNGWVYGAAWDAVSQYDHQMRRIDWQSLPIESVGNRDLLVSTDHVFSVNEASVDGLQSYRLTVFDRSDGRLVEMFDASRLPAGPLSMAIGEGVLVMPLTDGQVAVVGDTPLSMDLEIELSDEFPAVGHSIVVEVTATAPGGDLGDVRYRIDWGDGTEEEFRGSLASHIYTSNEERTLTVHATNDAYQEARATHTVHVGATPPSFIETAFAPDNQEATFFALGLIVTFLLAGFGLAARRRRQSVLRKELQAADDIVAEHEDKPDVMRERLRRHRARAENLFMQNRLDEAASNMLRSHIDDLLRSHRMGIVEEKLSFLPHGLFRSLQEILRDAQITALERTEFLTSLKEEKGLTSAQKRTVRSHIDTWAQQDAAA